MYWLKKIFNILKPLLHVTSGTGRLLIDVNNLTSITNFGGSATLPTVTTVGTVNTVSGVTNVANIGAISGYEVAKSTSKTAYNTGIRGRI